MARELVFATHNPDKQKEIQAMLPKGFSLLSLEAVHFNREITEDQSTIKGNALKKARTVYNETDYSCFADDTGLEVDALNGAPGVHSARFAGESATYQANLQKLLKNMEGETNRQARFKTIIALILNGEEYLFEGITEGFILEETQGGKGFGYDPVFRPQGYEETFAQMAPETKNRISHRGKAFSKMVSFLAEQ